MNYKLILLVSGLMLLSGSAYSAEYSQDITMYFGESADIGDYILEYGTQSGTDERVLSVGRWTDTSFLVMEEIEGADIYELEGEEIQISENMTMTIKRNGWDENGQFIEMDITSSQDVFSSAEISSSAPSKIIVSQGETANVPLTLSNTGYLNQTYDLGFETNSSLTASFGFQDFNVTEVYVPAGEEESVDAQINVPNTAELGTYEVKLTAENGTRLSESVQVEVRGAEVEREISLNIRESYTRTQPGEELEVPVRVRNGISGVRVIRDNPQGVALNNIEFDVTVPEGWDYEVSPETIGALEMRDRRQVMMTVEVPEDAQPGDFFVDVSASSEKASMEEPEQVRINVHEPSGMSTVGLVLMVISLGMLIFVYRKFGRR